VYWLFWVIPGYILWKVLSSDEQETLKRGKSKKRARKVVTFEERGDLEGPKVIVIGRTGAGKSSFINMLYGEPVLAVGPVASTTRWVEGVRVDFKHSNAVLVDTPGYGEIMTSEDYSSGLVHYVRKHKKEVRLVILIIQADSKAHAEDKRILSKIIQEHPKTKAIIVLSQVDKMRPIREQLEGSEWPLKIKRDATLKNKNIKKKINEISKQFGFEPNSITPSASDEFQFNRRKVLKLIENSLN